MIRTLVRKWGALTLMVALLFVAFSVIYVIWSNRLGQIQRELDVMYAVEEFREKHGHYPSTVTDLFELHLQSVSVNDLTIVKSGENSVTLSLSGRRAWGSGNSELIKLEYNEATGPPQWVTIDGKSR